MPSVLSPAQLAEYEQKGFTYARGLFARDEVRLLTEAMEKDPAVRDSILDRRDAEGRSTRIALWNRAGDSVYGLADRTSHGRYAARCRAAGAGGRGSPAGAQTVTVRALSRADCAPA